MNVYIVFNNKNREYIFWLSFLKRSYYLVLMLTGMVNLEKKYSSYIDSLQHVISGLVWFMVFNAPFNNIISVI
jgi:hypothetical protein